MRIHWHGGSILQLKLFQANAEKYVPIHRIGIRSDCLYNRLEARPAIKRYYAIFVPQFPQKLVVGLFSEPHF